MSSSREMQERNVDEEEEKEKEEGEVQKKERWKKCMSVIRMKRGKKKTASKKK